jgi:hypothetical protein
MNKELINFLFLIVGVLCGIIISTGIKYPLEIKHLDNLKEVCKDQPTKKIKISIIGKIVEAECTNGTIFRLD